VLPGDLTVRRARLDDWDGWRAAFDEVVAEGRWMGSEAPIDWDIRRPGFVRLVAGETGAAFVAVDGDGEIVGLSNGDLDPMGRVGLGMAIVDGYRGGGLGRRLLDAVVDWARQVGAHKVVLEVWPHNERARRLYESAGFVVDGHHRRHWRRRDGSLWDSVSKGLVLDETAPGSPS
jgi:RimJ/RimL family protein N-acetyltransferase